MKNIFKKLKHEKIDTDTISKTESILSTCESKPRKNFEQELETKLFHRMQNTLQNTDTKKQKFSYKFFYYATPIIILISLLFGTTNFVSAKFIQIVAASRKIFLNKEMGGPPVDSTNKKIVIEKQFIYPAESHKITQYFESPRHGGIDFAGKENSPVFASASGTITSSECGWNGGYGCYIVVDHGDGIESVYAHNKKLLVKEGDDVTQGQTIAELGESGYTSGDPQLHFEIRVNNIAVNPVFYLEK